MTMSSIILTTVHLYNNIGICYAFISWTVIKFSNNTYIRSSLLRKRGLKLLNKYGGDESVTAFRTFDDEYF